MTTKYQTEWDLKPLFKSDKDPQIEIAKKKAQKATDKFVNKWKKREDYLKDPIVLKEALDEYENWQKYYSVNFHEYFYFELKHALAENNPEIKAKLNKAIELSQKIQNDIQFFEIRIAKIDEKFQKMFLEKINLFPYKHFLEKLFANAKHILSEEEEKILNLKSVPAYDRWIRMLSGFLSQSEGKVITEEGETKIKNFSELTGLMNSQNKKTRNSAAKTFNTILKNNLEIAENEINSIFTDKKINDELKHFERPDSATLLKDDIEAEVVDTLVKVVSENFKVTKRYYQLKAKLFKVKKLKYHERNLEFGKITNNFSFDQSVELVQKITQKLDKDFLQIFEKFLSKGQIDVFPKKGKRNGGFCAAGLIIHPVYILLNHNGLLDDVRTLAHELGHGINDELIKLSQNSLNFGTPVSTAEVASTFFEDFLIEELMRNVNDETRLSLMVNKLNQDISSIFRQIALYNFEFELHKKIREKGYLSKEEIGKLFQKHMFSYMGEFIEKSEGSENWWVYWTHIRYYFYVYSYASGLLISKSLQASVKKDPKFILKVKEFLSVGLSDSPKNIFAKLGIDITDKKFWEKGISEISKLLSDTEILAKKLKKI